MTLNVFTSAKNLAAIMYKHDDWSLERTNAALKAGKGTLFDSAKRFGWKLITPEESDAVQPTSPQLVSPETPAKESVRPPAPEGDSDLELYDDEAQAKLIQQMLKDRKPAAPKSTDPVQKPKARPVVEEEDSDEGDDLSGFIGHVLICKWDLETSYKDNFESIKNVLIQNYKDKFELDEDALVYYVFARKIDNIPEKFKSEKYRKYNIQEDDLKEAVASAMKLARSNKKFFESLKKAAKTNDMNLVANMLLDYSEAVEHLDPKLSSDLLIQAKSILD